MSGWTSKYLVEGDHSFKGKNIIDFIPEDLFFRNVKELEEMGESWRDDLNWENVEAHYSVIKLDWPWEKTVRNDSGRTAKLKTTHAICLNGIPIFQLSSKSEDGKKVWEWERYEPRNIEFRMKENIIDDKGVTTKAHQNAVADLRMKYHKMASTDYGGSPKKVLAHQSRYALKDYNEWNKSNDSSGFPSNRLNMTLNAFLWKREIIVRRMVDWISGRSWAEKLGFPNLFYERVINPYTYPSDMHRGADWEKLTQKQRKEKMKDRENPDDPKNEQMASFQGLIGFILNSLSKIGDYHPYNNSPKMWKRLCLFLNALSKREWRRYQDNRLGIVNHSVITWCPILTVEQGMASLLITSTLAKNQILPVVYGDEESASGAYYINHYEGMKSPPATTDKWWAGMLLNGFNYYAYMGDWCFTDQATKIRRHIPWHSAMNYGMMDNIILWNYVETDMVKKTNKYPEGVISRKYGVLPPFVYKR